jgi:glutamyl-tRNA reductase
VTRPLAALVAHARAVPAGDRAALSAAIRATDVRGGVLLETCHRVELIGPARVVAVSGHESVAVPLLDHQATIRHVVRLAVGLESAVVGEDQILHQLRAAARAARAAGSLDPVVDHLLDVALRSGRLARTWLPARRPTLADAALDAALASRPDETLAPRLGAVLVVGAGPMGRLVAATASSRHLAVVVASRTRGRAERVAIATGGTAVNVDPGPAALAQFRAVVVALGGPWVVAPSSADALVASGARLVDVSAPRAVDAALAGRLGARLTSIDDLALGGDPVEPALRSRLEALVERTVADFRAWEEAEADRSLARALVARATDARSAELDALWQRVPDLDGTARVEIERMAAQLTRRLLRDPLERLGDDADGRHRRAAAELFRL